MRVDPHAVFCKWGGLRISYTIFFPVLKQAFVVLNSADRGARELHCFIPGALIEFEALLSLGDNNEKKIKEVSKFAEDTECNIFWRGDGSSKAFDP
jgi:hypothetical protein